MDTAVRRQSFYFSDGPYLQALQGLHSALSEPGALVKLIGQPRTGKSGVCEKLVQFLRHKDYQVVYFDYAIESPEMFWTMLAQELNLPDSFGFAEPLEDVLLESDKPLIIVFDDAHLLTDIILLVIHRLANIHLKRQGMVNILLCGEPALEKRLLDREDSTSLQHHVSHNFVLDPMDAETTTRFLQAYLAKAGLPELQLETAALSYFYKSCKGFPGLAGSLSHLLVAARQGQTAWAPVSKDELSRLIKQADAGQSLPTLHYRENKQWLALGPLMAVLVIASLAILYQQLNNSELGLLADTRVVDDSSPFSAAEAELAKALSIEPGELAQGLVDATLENRAEDTDSTELAVVSDSNLALVTAAEIGIAAADIAEPLFEQLAADSAAAVIKISAAGGELMPATLSLSDADRENELAGNVVKKIEVKKTEVEKTEAAKIETATAEVATAVAELEQTTIRINAEAEAVEPSLASASIIELATPAEEIAPAEKGVTVEAEMPQTSVASAINITRAAAEPQEADSLTSSAEEVSSTPLSVEQTVRDWVNAWETQSIDVYFSSYDADFEPRYHRNRREWRQSRERVIGNANRISLELRDFDIVSEDSNAVEVHFWLAYQSPTYRDNTHKKLVLRKQLASEQENAVAQAVDRWLIVEEVNLEVRR